MSAPEKQKLKESFKPIVHEVENLTGLIGLRVETLQDLECKLGHLRESMDTAVHKGQEQLFYPTHHQDVRMLSELMRYTMDDLNGLYEKLIKTRLDLFEAVIR